MERVRWLKRLVDAQTSTALRMPVTRSPPIILFWMAMVRACAAEEEAAAEVDAAAAAAASSGVFARRSVSRVTDATLYPFQPPVDVPDASPAPFLAEAATGVCDARD